MKHIGLTSNCIDRVNSINALKNFSNKSDRFFDSIFLLENDFAELANERLISDLLNFELSKISTEQFYYPEDSNEFTLNILSTKKFNLFLSYIKNDTLNKSNKNVAYSKDTMVMSLSKQPINYSLYLQKEPFPVDILDKSKKLEEIIVNKDLHYGKVLKLRKHHDILILDNTTDSNQLILTIESTTEDGLVWEYNNQYLPCSITSKNEEPLRLENLCVLFGKMGNKSSLESLKILLNNKFYNVRWAAAKAIMLIDTKEGLNALEMLSHDNHPEVRDTSIKHLAYVKNILNLN